MPVHLVEVSELPIIPLGGDGLALFTQTFNETFTVTSTISQSFYVYPVQFPGGELGGVVMTATAGDVFIVLAVMGLGVLALFDLVVRTANAMRGGK